MAKEAGPEAQPAEALYGRRHPFSLLRGEAELAEDRARAERSPAVNNDPSDQRKPIRLAQARNALCPCEAGLNGAGADRAP